MLNNKTIAVVIPVFNEGKKILEVIQSVPDFVDRIIVVNDGSKDDTASAVRKMIDMDTTDYLNDKIGPVKIKGNSYNAVDVAMQEYLEAESRFYCPQKIYNPNPGSSRLILINHQKNQGVGKAVTTGYKWCRDNEIDCVAKLDGDGQMDPDELQAICEPVVLQGVDYVKGNRLIYPGAHLIIPRIRHFGNAILSILTKIASGYWHISDTQTGYTAISLRALKLIKLYKIFSSYGYPNDVLVRLNTNFCTITEIPIKPVYKIGERSNMRIYKVIPSISFLLVKGFFKRLWQKYMIRSFHPLFILYNIGFLLLACSVPFGLKILNKAIHQVGANPVTVLAFIFLFFSGFQSLLFAMWMDIQDNERLNK